MSAYQSTPLCLALQKNIEEISTLDNIIYARPKTGLLDSLLAQGEGMGFLVSDKGPYTAIEIKYTQRDESTVSEVFQACPTGVQTDTKLVTVLPNLHATQSFSFSVDELNAICKSPEEIQGKRILDCINAINKKVNEKLITLFWAAVGNYYGGTVNSGTTPITVDLVSGTPLAVQYPEMYKILDEFDMISNGAGRPILVGAKELKQYVAMANLGCCNAQGLDITKSNGEFAFFADYQVDTVINDGDEHYLGYIPGALQLITTNRYRPPFSVMSETQQQGTLTDPNTGLVYDMFMKMDCEVWTVTLSMWYNLYIQPDDIYTGVHDLNGVNQLLNFTKV